MKKHFYLLMFLLGSAQLFSQDCENKLRGRVIDFHDGLPLKEAQITVDNQKVITNSKGEFLIEKLCPIAYAFTITHPDCNTQVVTIDIGEKKQHDFYLEHHYTNLEEVDILDVSKKGETNSQTEVQLQKKQLEKYSNLTLGDALKELSGVNSLTTGNTIVKPVIQGLHSSRIIIMNNGVRQEDQEWGEEHAPNIDINAFDELKVIKGAGALQYGGNAIGGVVIGKNKLTTLRDTTFGKTQITGSTNGRGGSINSTLNIGFKNNWSTKIQGTIKHYGDSEAPDYILTNTGFREQSLSAAIGYTTFEYGFEGYYSFYNAKQGILRASHIGNVGDLVRGINSDEPLVIDSFSYDINAPKQETNHHLGKLKFYKRFKNTGKLNLQYAFQLNNRKEFDIRRGDDRNKASLDLELKTHTLDGSFVFDSNNSFKKTIGFQALTQKNTPNPETGIRRLVPDYDKNNIGIFAITDFELNDKLKADIGGRYDYSRIEAKKFYLKSFWEDRGYDTDFESIIVADFDTQWFTEPTFDYHSFSASAGINYQLKEKQRIRTNASFVNRAPNPVELFSDGLHHSAAIIELGDLRFEQEKALKFSGSYSNENFLKSKGSFIASPHVSIIDDFILLQPTGVEQTIRGAFPVWEYKQTRALLYGIDIDYKVKFTDVINFETGFSYVYGEDLKNETPLISMPAPNFRSGITYEKPKWNIKLTNETVLKQTRYPDNNFTTEFLRDGVIVEEVVDISTPPPAYTVFDVYAEYKMSILNEKDLSLGMSITNILDTSYRDYLNRQRFYADNIGRNITLNINFKF